MKRRAMVLGPYLRRRPTDGAGERAGEARSPAARLEEAVGLARAIDLDVVEAGAVPLAGIRPATYLGKGKVEEIAGIAKSQAIDLVVMDCAVSPVQQRNLEKAWNAKVLDRTGLILEIFGERARTREGQLQVELAALTYQRSRLVRSWTHLERQRGGFGFLGGPGETQIELDRRQIRDRIKKLNERLAQVSAQRRGEPESTHGAHHATGLCAGVPGLATPGFAFRPMPRFASACGLCSVSFSRLASSRSRWITRSGWRSTNSCACRNACKGGNCFCQSRAPAMS